MASEQSAPPAADRPATVLIWGTLLIVGGALAVALPFAVLMLGERPPGRGVLWDFAMGLGFGALALAALQFALTGRLRWLTHPFGVDIVYYFHRYLSWGTLALMLAHFGILYVWYEPELGVLNPLEARWELTAARVALVCFLALVISSELRRWLRLKYQWWRIMHVVLAVVAFGAAVAHVLGVGNLTATFGKQALWAGVTLGWLGLLAWTRLGRPAFQARNPWRVVGNTPHPGGIHTLELAPEGAPLRFWKPGQFAWLTIGGSPFGLNEHPFTISSAPEQGPNLSFSIKPLGDDTAELVETKVGTRAYVDGPYGAFSIDRYPDAEGFVMVAGGVGITPMLANLHAMRARSDRRPVVLFHANSDWDSIGFHGELEVLRRDLDLTLIHVLEQPPEAWDGESGYLDAGTLGRHLPLQSRHWPHLLCGPAPMTAAVRNALRARGVPEQRVASEVFELA